MNRHAARRQQEPRDKPPPDEPPGDEPTGEPPRARAALGRHGASPRRSHSHGAFGSQAAARARRRSRSGRQLAATLTPARRHDGAPGAGAHPQPEAVRLGPPAIVRLERALAHVGTPSFEKQSPPGWTAQVRPALRGDDQVVRIGVRDDRRSPGFSPSGPRPGGTQTLQRYGSKPWLVKPGSGSRGLDDPRCRVRQRHAAAYCRRPQALLGSRTE